jgi:hypothetical protein
MEKAPAMEELKAHSKSKHFSMVTAIMAKQKDLSFMLKYQPIFCYNIVPQRESVDF